jgi:aspartate racemase
VKTIGLIGGMSWESTAIYYRLLNEGVKQRLGGLHSAKIIIYSVDFHEIERLQGIADWNAAGALLAGIATVLEAAGAQCLLIGANTMHKVAPAVEAAVRIPVLHVVDATAGQIRREGLSTVGLLGTRFTMEQDFYVDRLRDRHGLQVLVPAQQERDIVHRIIFEELVVGRLLERSRVEFRRIIAELVAQGAQGIILGCTEFSLLLRAEDSAVPLFDTTRLHAAMATDWALSTT